MSSNYTTLAIVCIHAVLKTLFIIMNAHMEIQTQPVLNKLVFATGSGAPMKICFRDASIYWPYIGIGQYSPC